ncbi:RWD domain-containing protein, putative [Eimeria necatrix]|uniref:RWD domain-containing protein, putative n=1 Tax=Eimeria necatrix TaxID=51315 RepID=U6MWZ8_9EIME|nr:RWD domain-containing protein, putative [Eimeria necatrix]CDJ66240.1 RWD domain-containing protein, putative [Eimeria necatrix]
MYDQMVSRQQQQTAAAAAAAADEEDSNLYKDSDSQEEQSPGNGPADRPLCPENERCSKEEFERWAAAFAEEMISKGIWGSSSSSNVVTGKQLFLENAAAAAAAADEEEAAASAAFWNDADVFERDAKGLSDEED